MKVTRWQRVLCLILAAILILQAAPVTASAREPEPAVREEYVPETQPAQPLPAEPAEILPPEPEPEAEVCTDGDFTYKALGETTCEITKYTGTAKNVVVPEQLGGYTVTRIGSQAFYAELITSVSLPGTIREIGESAFAHCTDLTQIAIPAGVTELGPFAFSGCSGLTSVVLPAGLQSMGASVFQSCIQLVSIDLPEGLESIGESAFSGCRALTQIAIPAGVTELGSFAFSGCSGLTSVELPAGLQSLGASVFQSCIHLASIDLPEGLESIGESAFSGCSALTQIAIPAGVTELGSFAFSSCSGLTSVVLPAGLQSMGASVFQSCIQLVSIDLPEGLESIGESAFSYCTALTQIAIPAGVKEIQLHTFSFCTNLVSVELPEGLTAIHGDVFCFCESLEDINLPDSLVTLGQFAFAYCTALKQITIPAGVTQIQDQTFVSCGNLASVDLPEGLISLGDMAFGGCAITSIDLPESLQILDGAFGGCTLLTQITIPAGVTELGSSAFSGCTGLTSVELPAGLESIGWHAFQKCRSLETIDLPENLQSLDTGVFKDCTRLIRIRIPDSITELPDSAFEGCTALTDVELPAGLTAIGENAFKKCEALTTLALPETLGSIGKEAFSYCTALETIDLPGGLTTLGTGIFSWCTGLTEVTIPEGITLLPSGTFDNCASLTNVHLPSSLTDIGDGAFSCCTSLTEVVVPQGVTVIPSYCFSDCTNLRSVVLPEGLQEISYCAFLYCPNLLTIVIPEGVTFIADNAFYNPDLIILAVPGSYAWDYAVSNGISVADMDQTVSVLYLNVTDDTGDRLTGGYTVNWYRTGEEEPFATGTVLQGLEKGTYEYELILDDSLCFDFVQPGRQTVELGSGQVELTLTLQRLDRIWLTGTITDAAGVPIPGAKLSLTQICGSARREAGAVTDENGAYAVLVATVKTTGTVTAEGYFSRELSLDLSACSSDIEFSAQLNPLPSNKITLELSVRRTGSAAPTSLFHEAVDLSFRVENLTRKTTVTGHVFQKGALVLPEDAASAGDTLRITASDNGGTMADAVAELRLDAQKNGAASFVFTEHGRLELTELTGCEQIVMLLFDEQGRFVTSAGVSGGYTGDPLAPGSYSVVLMEQSELLRTTEKLENLTVFGLEAGVDYVVRTVRITDGEITRVSGVFVPTLDPARFNYTVEKNTSFTVNEAMPFAGEYIVLRLAYEIDGKYPSSDEKIRIRLAPELGMAGESLTLDGKRHLYSLDGDVLTVAADQPSGVIRLYIQPEYVGRYTLEATLEFTSGEKKLIQPLGSVDLNVVAAEYDLIDRTCNGVVPVFGTALPNATIVFYDWGEEIATVTSNYAGSFRAELPLKYAGKYTYHEITATVEHERLNQPLEVAPQTVINDAGYAMVSKVTMISASGKTYVLDYLYPGTPPSFSSPSYVWTYIVEFVDDGAKRVKNVCVDLGQDSLYARPVECVYDEAGGRWVGTGGEPNAVSVSYDIIPAEADADEVTELDDELLDKAEEEYRKYLEEIEDALENVETEDPARFAPMSFEVLFQEIDKYIGGGTGDIDDAGSSGGTAGNGGATSDGTTTRVELDGPKGTYTEKPADSNVADNPEGSGFKKVGSSGNGDIYEKKNADGNTYIVKPNDEDPDQEAVEIDIVIQDLPELPEQIPLGDYSAAEAYMDTLEKNLNVWLGICDEYYDTYDYTAQLENLKKVAQDNKNAENALKEAKEKIDAETDPVKKKAAEASYQKKSANLQNRIDDLDNAKKRLAWTRFGLKGAMNFLGIVGMIKNVKELIDDMDTLKQFEKAMPKSCPADPEGLKELRSLRDYTSSFVANSGALSIGADAVSVVSGIASVFAAPASGGGSIAAKVAVNGLIAAGQIAREQAVKHLLDNFEARLNALDCNGDGAPDGYGSQIRGKKNSRGSNTTPAQPTRPIRDPSGYVYEAVPSNRVEGVKAECYYLGYALDEYGIPKEEPEDILWNAEDYDQVNPLYTDENGRFQWDVPEGKWLVKFSKDGYYDTDSRNDPAAVDGYLPVPPPQVDVNTAIVSREAPVVEHVNIYEDRIQILFSQYMQPDTVSGKTVTVTGAGKRIQGTLTPVNAEYNYDQTAQYASVFTFTPETRLSGNVDVQVSGCVNYAGTAMADAYACSGPVEYRPERIQVDAQHMVYWNESNELTIRILPVQAGANKTISVGLNAPAILSSAVQMVTTDAAGTATLKLTGLLPGCAQLTLDLDGTDISASVDVTVGVRSKVCEKVTANLPTGSVVAAGTELILSTSTEGAQIYYTLDGTCPCVEDSPSRIRCTGPIVLNEDTFLIAYAVKEGMEDSVTSGFIYSICTHPDTLLENERKATCTEDGYTGDVICADCGTVVEQGSDTEALGHSFGAWANVGNGMEERKCERCGFAEQRPAGGPVNPFTDVPGDSFYYEPVLWAVEKGITNGTTPTNFGPDDQCMRAHVVTFLWRAAGYPEPTSTVNPFVDVKQSDFFYKAVLWAVEEGVTNGSDATHFNPFGVCNRAQVVTFLHRAMGSPVPESMELPFTDVPAGTWYAAPITWAVENGITNGLSASQFGPNAACNRAQVVTFLYRTYT